MTDTVLKLSRMSCGFTGRITAIENDHSPQASHHLRELGFSEGLDIALLHQSPLSHDPIAVQVGDITIALRRHLADLVSVVSDPA